MFFVDASASCELVETKQLDSVYIYTYDVSSGAQADTSYGDASSRQHDNSASNSQLQVLPAVPVNVVGC